MNRVGAQRAASQSASAARRGIGGGTVHRRRLRASARHDALRAPSCRAGLPGVLTHCTRMRHFSKASRFLREVPPLPPSAARRADRGHCRGRVDGCLRAGRRRCACRARSRRRSAPGVHGSPRRNATAPRFGDSLDAALPPLAPPVPSALRPPAAPEERGAVFLRADRLEGTRRQARRGLGQGRAAHAPRDRARGLADVRHREGRDLGEGQRHAAQGPRLDQRARAQVPARARDRLLRRAALLHLREPVARRGRRRSASRARTCTRRARRNTRLALRRTTTGTCAADEIEVDKLRKVGTARDASVYFLGVPVMYTPWLEFPLSNERKSGFLTPTIGSTQIRGFEFAAPYYFNLAPNYDATVTPRIMTRARRADRGARAATCSSSLRGPGHRRDRAGRPHDRRHALGGLVEAQPAVRAVARAATSTTTACRTTRTSPTSPTASR